MIGGLFMSGGLLLLGILFLTIVAPIWIVAHYVALWRRSRGLSASDERALAELWESARRLEGRIVNLEQLLDAEAPGWRGREGAPAAGVWGNGPGRGAP